MPWSKEESSLLLTELHTLIFTFIVHWLETSVSRNAGDWSEVDESSSFFFVHHDVQFLEVAVDNSFLVQKEQTHADVLNDLEFLLLVELAIGQTAGVVLKVEFSVWEGHDGVVAIVLGEVGTNFVPHVVEEVELVLQGGLHLLLLLVASLLYQMAPCLHVGLGIHHIVHWSVDA